MPGDYSRSTFDVAKHYSDVRWQQGRVQLDADFNEWTDILRHRLATQIADLVGPAGAPSRDAGFHIRAQDGRVIASPGRMYVGGLLCENDASFDVATVDDNGQPLPPGAYLVYLDVWEREVSYLEDPQLADPAMGEVDTTVRRKTAFRVRLRALPTGGGPERNAKPTGGGADRNVKPTDRKRRRLANDLPRRLEAFEVERLELEAHLSGLLEKLEANPSARKVLERFAERDKELAELAASFPDEAKFIVERQSIRDERDLFLRKVEPELLQAIAETRARIAANLEMQAQFRAEQDLTPDTDEERDSDPADVIAVGARQAFEELRQAAGADRRPRLRPVLAQHVADLANQLYRIELHGGPGGAARTVKWSRDNASDACRGRLKGTRITVERWTNGAQSRFRAGDWIEINDLAGIEAGRPGTLVPLEDVADESLVISEKFAFPDLKNDEPDVLVTRWDGTQDLERLQLQDDGEIAQAQIERGLSALFEIPPGAAPRDGDYWLVATRQQGEPLLWPRAAHEDRPYAARGPEGRHHAYAPLALVTLGKNGQVKDEPADLRPVFSPTVDGALRKTGDEMQGDLKINAQLIVTQRTLLEGDLTVKRATSVAGELSVGQRAALGGALEVAGAITGRDTLSVAGRANFRSLFVGGGETPASGLFVQCDSTTGLGGMLFHERGRLAWRQTVQGTLEGPDATRLSFQVVDPSKPTNVIRNDVLVVSGRGNGGVGVGVVPETMLHVKEDGRFDGGLRVDKHLSIGTDYTGAAVNIRTASTSPFEVNDGRRALIIGTNAGPPDHTPSLGIGVFSTGEPRTRNYSWLDTSGAPLAINPTGRNVAVGHADPQANLHVKGTFRVTDSNGRDVVKVEGSEIRFDGPIALNSRNDRPVVSREAVRILAATIFWTFSNSRRWEIKDQTGGVEFDVFGPIGTVKFATPFSAVPVVIATPPQFVPTAPFGDQRKGSDFLQIQNVSNTGFRIVTEGNWNPSEGNVYGILVIGRA